MIQRYRFETRTHPFLRFFFVRTLFEGTSEDGEKLRLLVFFMTMWIADIDVAGWTTHIQFRVPAFLPESRGPSGT